ncbi:MarR family winged helix-turn-helix transcriptional regulator [Nocardia huaxiensis]|uniref:MarR family transcriptional regulator n=1 Tax=Nocardia huaxiensis TaxID=2755382 RepID=A0A7D6VLT6_9NOCA|nr:MarR family transcriptional regulator [Nocardia huaxiensis]QLY32696.1 MarR family transcriptional regulator [Nocardia huaxiensis]UFS93569.1 MarR family transcriptional regulator [Nocardia huaxiensis]
MNHPATRAQQDQLTEGLRAHGANYREFSRRFAAWLGLHSTDAEALIEILGAEERGAALSPARLSERIALSQPATTALLNRLEKAGHVLRTREHSDRRIVTLRGSTRVHDLADEFFRPLGEEVAAVMGRYSAAQLQQFENFLTELTDAMNNQLAQPIPPLPHRNTQGG